MGGPSDLNRHCSSWGSAWAALGRGRGRPGGASVFEALADNLTLPRVPAEGGAGSAGFVASMCVRGSADGSRRGFGGSAGRDARGACMALGS